MESRFKKYSPTIVLWVFAFGLLGGIWYMTLTQLGDLKSRHIHYAEQDAKSFARIFQEHTIRTLHTAEQITLFLEYLYQEQGRRLNISQVHKIGLDKDLFKDVSIYGMDGSILASTSVDDKNWDQHKELAGLRKEAGRRVYVSKPVYESRTEKWAIYICRRITGGPMRADALVCVSMDPFYFLGLYNSVINAPHSIISLNGTDGVIRARISDGKTSLGQDISQTWLFPEMGNTEGSMRGSSVVDGRERLFSYRTIDNYPLSVVVGLDVEEVLKSFKIIKKQRTTLAALVSVVIIIFVFIIVLLMRQLIISTDKAIAANNAKTQFLSNMSHELRTPLNGILGYAELLTQYLPKGELSAFARYIHESGLHLLSLVNAILQLNKMAAGHEKVAAEKVDTHELVNQARNAHAVNALKKGVEISSQVDVSVPEEIVCDRVKVLQILNNLLSNAVKFTLAGQVRIAVNVDSESMYFSVSDTGPGIPPEMRDMVFNQFFQVNENSSSSMTGTGLGLAIAREMAILMGGSISLQSEMGKGSTFTLSIPQRNIKTNTETSTKYVSA